MRGLSTWLCRQRRWSVGRQSNLVLLLANRGICSILILHANSVLTPKELKTPLLRFYTLSSQRGPWLELIVGSGKHHDRATQNYLQRERARMPMHARAASGGRLHRHRSQARGHWPLTWRNCEHDPAWLETGAKPRADFALERATQASLGSGQATRRRHARLRWHWLVEWDGPRAHKNSQFVTTARQSERHAQRTSSGPQRAREHELNWYCEPK